MTRLADEHEQAAMEALGADLVRRTRAFVEAEFGPQSDEALSELVGRFVISAFYAAGNEVDWLCRVRATDGIGKGLGFCFAQAPPGGGEVALYQRLQAGLAAGRAELREGQE